MSTDSQPSRILLTGMGGVLGVGLAQAWRDVDPANFLLVGRTPVRAWRASKFVQLDLRQAGQFTELLQSTQPQVVLHGAAMARVDECQANPDAARQVNCASVAELMHWAESHASRVVYCSTDQVFDGQAMSYHEDDATSPLHEYGRNKVVAEQIALAGGASVVRLPLLLGPEAAPGHMGADQAVLQASRAGRILQLFDDEFRAPAAANLLADALWTLMDPAVGAAHAARVFHLAGCEAVSRFELGKQVCHAAALAFEHQSASLSDWTGAARPARLVLNCQRAGGELGFMAPDLRQSLARLRDPSPSNSDTAH